MWIIKESREAAVRPSVHATAIALFYEGAGSILTHEVHC